MSDLEMIEKLRAMPMHQISNTNQTGDFVLRVAGGWVYGFPRLQSTVFVPEPSMTVYATKGIDIDADEEALKRELERIEEVIDEEDDNGVSSESV